jgi:hypothetical protein
MSRSVSYPSGCTVVCFRDLPYYGDDDDLDGYDDTLAMYAWDDFVDWLRETATTQWSSLYNSDEWLDREDHALLENDLCYIGVSSYGSIVSVWLKSKGDELRDDYYPENVSQAALADHWCEQIAEKFSQLFGQYRKLGTFSNGESVYEAVEVSRD